VRCQRHHVLVTCKLPRRHRLNGPQQLLRVVPAGIDHMMLTPRADTPLRVSGALPCPLARNFAAGLRPLMPLPSCRLCPSPPDRCIHVRPGSLPSAPWPPVTLPMTCGARFAASRTAPPHPIRVGKYALLVQFGVRVGFARKPHPPPLLQFPSQLRGHSSPPSSLAICDHRPQR